MSVSTHEELIRSYIDAYNRFDLDGMCALLASDIHFEHYADGVLAAHAHGLHAFRDLAEAGAAMFDERAQRITALRVDGDRAVAEIAFQGKLAADAPGGPAVVALDGTSEFTFDAGCIRRIVDRS